MRPLRLDMKIINIREQTPVYKTLLNKLYLPTWSGAFPHIYISKQRPDCRNLSQGQAFDSQQKIIIGF